VLPSDLVWSTLIWLTTGAQTLVILLGVAAVLSLARRRPVGAGLLRGLLAAVGFVLGFLIVGTAGSPTNHLPVLIASVVLVVAVAWTRPRTGGAVLLAIALPWTAWWGSFVLDDVLAGQDWDLAAVAPPLLAGVVAALAGLVLVTAGGRPERLRHGTRQAAEPQERRFGAASRAILGPGILGVTAHELASGLILLLVGVGTAALLPGRPAVESGLVIAGGIVVAWGLCCASWILVRRPRDRRAWEAFTWLGEWELDRFRALAGGPALPTPNDFRRLLTSSPDRPDLAWIRAEMLVMDRRFDEARAAAGMIPDDTPYGHVEREAALTSIDWHSGGPGDTAALRSAVDAVIPATGDERLRAEVVFASAEVRRLLAAGDPDPTRPMRAARDLLGHRADGILWRVMRRRLWPKVLRAAFLIVLVVVGLDRLVTPG
jgi:hypothetical protein